LLTKLIIRGGGKVKDSYNFQAIAKKIVAVLEQEKVPIILIPKVFEAVNDDIFEHTIPYKPNCLEIKDLPTSATKSNAIGPKG